MTYPAARTIFRKRWTEHSAPSGNGAVHSLVAATVDRARVSGDSPCQTMRKIYLKIATRALVVAAIVNEALKRLWAEQAKDLLKGMVENHHYRDAIFLGLQLLSLLLVFEALALAIMWAFNRFRFVRMLVDGIFDVEGSYLETVFINDELEVVGVNHISFVDGELKVDSELHWPRQASDEKITLKKVANTSSLKEMCTASDDVLRYAFGDDYLDPQYDKIGLTALKLHRSRRPTLLTRLFKKTRSRATLGRSLATRARSGAASRGGGSTETSSAWPTVTTTTPGRASSSRRCRKRSGQARSCASSLPACTWIPSRNETSAAPRQGRRQCGRPGGSAPSRGSRAYRGRHALPWRQRRATCGHCGPEGNTGRTRCGRVPAAGQRARREDRRSLARELLAE